MPTPSLLIVPARFKSGKMYSQIPTSGAGDFTVTRATSATRVNASGLIESVASGIPRLDYFASGGTVGCPALLVEPSGSNLFLQSAGFQVSGNWGNGLATVTTGSTAAFTAPDNSTDADLITATAAGFSYIDQNITIASGTYTISVFAKAGNYGLFRIGNVASASRAAWFNLNAGAVTGTVNGGTASMQNYGNGWYRCIYTSSGMVSGSTFFAPSNAPNSTIAVSGSSIYFWGAQLETGSVATSYIPTTTAAVTRNADVVAVSGAVSGSIGQTEGTIYAEFDWRSRTEAQARIVFGVGQAGTTNAIRISFGGTNQLQITGLAINVSVVAVSQAALGQFPEGRTKAALAYDSNGVQLFVNGTALALGGLTGSYPPLNSIVLGNRNADQFLNDRIRAAALYTTRLTNDQLAALTTV